LVERLFGRACWQQALYRDRCLKGPVAVLNETIRKVASSMHFSSRSVLFVLVAALFVGVVGTASASAEACHKKAGSGSYALCVEGEKVTSPLKVSFESVIEPETEAKLKVKAWEGGEWGGRYILCQRAGSKGEIELPNGKTPLRLGAVHVTLSKCHYKEGPACRVEAFESSVLEGRFGSLAHPGVENLTLGTLEERFGTLWLASEETVGHCPFTTTNTIRGSGPECLMKEVQVEKAAQELVCEGANSHLSLYEQAVELTAKETLTLTYSGFKGKKFSIIET
jgi:hypothetical protein